MSFFSFLQVFEWRIWNRCLGVGRRKLFRKCFCSYIELKKECCECLKRSFCSFFQSFGWRSWNHFLGKCGKAFKAVKSKCDHRKLHRKWIWRYLKLKDECSKRLNRASLSYFQSFECRSWSHFLGNSGKTFKSIKVKVWL